jgi:hypothetical protein
MNLLPPSAPTSGIRQLFTVPENIRMAQYGHEIYGQFETLMAVDADIAPIDFHREGYLWPGSGKDDIDALIANWRVQTAHDARVELLDRKGVQHRFPSGCRGSLPCGETPSARYAGP